MVLPGGYQLLELAPYVDPSVELVAGKRWTDVAGEIGIVGVGRRTFTAEVTVMGQESVRVPAGEFKAWRLDAVSSQISLAGNGSSTQLKCTYWYAPSARRSVKMTIKLDTPIIAAQADEAYELLVMKSKD